MHKELVLSAFKKARREAKEATGVNMSVTGIAKRISDYMMDECHFQYHEKSLRNKYNLALKNGQDVELKSSVANCLCCYLGYENYAEFIMKNNVQETITEIVEHVSIEEETPKKEPSIGEKLKIVIQKNKVTLIFCSLIFLLYFGLYMINRQQWMIWDTDRYVEVPFDLEKYGLSNLKLYKHERIKNFREVRPDCNYLFFKSDGSENLWYQKGTNGELEFFTSSGLHPETGKTLKKITPAIIRKHICETY
jgi:hypothetical protein